MRLLELLRLDKSKDVMVVVVFGKRRVIPLGMKKPL